MYDDKPCKPGAFTLIELLVVVAIIAVLIAVLLPSLQHARQSAASLKCQANVREIGMAMNMYATDHSGHLPPQNSYPSSQAYTANARKDWWPYLIESYVGRYASRKYAQVTSDPDGLFVCPNDKESRQLSRHKISYGTSYGILFRYPDMYDGHWTNKLGATDRIGQVTDPSGVYMVMDSVGQFHVYNPKMYDRDQPTGRDLRLRYDTNNNGIADCYVDFATGNGAAFRHQQGLSIVFVDGHAEHQHERVWAIGGSVDDTALGGWLWPQ